jgi:hypothetical protein
LSVLLNKNNSGVTIEKITADISQIEYFIAPSRSSREA